MSSSLELTLKLQNGSSWTTIFDGTIALQAPTVGSEWVTTVLGGGMASVSGVQSAVASGFTLASTQAELTLANVAIPYTLPIKIGQNFTFELEMSTYAYVPANVVGGAEAEMGQPPQLDPSYLSSSSSSPSDVPEPATLCLLALGAFAVIRRRTRQ